MLFSFQSMRNALLHVLKNDLIEKKMLKFFADYKGQGLWVGISKYNDMFNLTYWNNICSKDLVMSRFF